MPVTVPGLGMVVGAGNGDAKEVLGLTLENLLLSEGDTGQVWITHPPAENNRRGAWLKV